MTGYTRDKNRARLYRLTPVDYARILEYQNGCCALCYRPLDRDEAVDHDHSEEDKRRFVRGILHSRCNSNLGWLEANPHLISESVRAYLEKPPAQQILSGTKYESPWRKHKHEIKLIAGIKQKWCNGCSTYHPIIEFGVFTSNPCGLRNSCRAHHAKLIRRKRKRRKESLA
jgi:hypothetical protein